MMTIEDAIGVMTPASAVIAVSAAGAFGALFCRVRQLTLWGHVSAAWVFYTCLAMACGLIGIRAALLATWEWHDVLTLAASWAVVAQTFAEWGCGVPSRLSRKPT